MNVVAKPRTPFADLVLGKDRHLSDYVHYLGQMILPRRLFKFVVDLCSFLYYAYVSMQTGAFWVSLGHYIIALVFCLWMGAFFYDPDFAFFA